MKLAYCVSMLADCLPTIDEAMDPCLVCSAYARETRLCCITGFHPQHLLIYNSPLLHVLHRYMPAWPGTYSLAAGGANGAALRDASLAKPCDAMLVAR